MRARRAIPCLGAVLLVLLSAPGAAAATPVTGVVVGVVRNGTAGAGSASVRGLAVEVRALEQDGREGALLCARTDEVGVFRVDGVELATGRQFVATVDYRGVLYRSEVARFPAGAQRLDLSVVVFEPVETADAVRVERVHVIIEFQREHIFVTNLLAVRNEGDRTIVGRRWESPPDPRRPGAASVGRGELASKGGAASEGAAQCEVLRLPLARNVSEVRFQDDILGALSRVADGELVIGRPLPPGRGQIVFSYLVPRGRDSAQFEVAFPYGAAVANLLVPDIGAVASVEGMEMQGLLEGDGQKRRYLNFGGEKLGAGDRVTVRLSQIPAELPPRGAPSPPSLGAGPVEWPWWLVLGLALAGLGLGTSSLHRVRKVPPAIP